MIKFIPFKFRDFVRVLVKSCETSGGKLLDNGQSVC